jgi:hypothetical protein
MNSVAFIINKLRECNRVLKTEENLKINLRWERAKEFGDYLGLSTPFILMLVNKFGEKKVFSLRSWLKDIPHDRSLEGLTIWKLKTL